MKFPIAMRKIITITRWKYPAICKYSPVFSWKGCSLVLPNLKHMTEIIMNTMKPIETKLRKKIFQLLINLVTSVDGIFLVWKFYLTYFEILADRINSRIIQTWIRPTASLATGEENCMNRTGSMESITHVGLISLKMSVMTTQMKT